MSKIDETLEIIAIDNESDISANDVDSQPLRFETALQLADEWIDDCNGAGDGWDQNVEDIQVAVVTHHAVRFNEHKSGMYDIRMEPTPGWNRLLREDRERKWMMTYLVSSGVLFNQDGRLFRHQTFEGASSSCYIDEDEMLSADVLGMAFSVRLHRVHAEHEWMSKFLQTLGVVRYEDGETIDVQSGHPIHFEELDTCPVKQANEILALWKNSLDQAEKINRLEAELAELKAGE